VCKCGKNKSSVDAEVDAAAAALTSKERYVPETIRSHLVSFKVFTAHGDFFGENLMRY
jgi:hypothetical protein